MTSQAAALRVGARLRGHRGRSLGTVDAIFADYLLVRTAGLMPVDLYVPLTDVTITDGLLSVTVDRDEAYERWHRPLKRAPHDE